MRWSGQGALPSLAATRVKATGISFHGQPGEANRLPAGVAGPSDAARAAWRTGDTGLLSTRV